MRAKLFCDSTNLILTIQKNSIIINESVDEERYRTRSLQRAVGWCETEGGAVLNHLGARRRKRKQVDRRVASALKESVLLSTKNKEWYSETKVVFCGFVSLGGGLFCFLKRKLRKK